MNVYWSKSRKDIGVLIFFGGSNGADVLHVVVVRHENVKVTNP